MLVRKTPRNQDKSIMTSFSSKSTEMFLGCALVLLPGVAGKSKLTSLHPASVHSVYASMENHVLRVQLTAMCSLLATAA